MICKDKLAQLVQDYAPCLKGPVLKRVIKCIESITEIEIHEKARNVCESCTKKKECEYKHG